MAGSYADVPNHRIAYDRDGSIGFKIRGTDNGLESLTTAQLQSMNNEAVGGVTVGSGTGGPRSYLGLIFPTLRTVVGYFIDARQFDGTYTSPVMETSTNTSTGLDGAWSTTTFTRSESTVPEYRTAIQLVSFSNIKAIRWKADSNAGSGAITYHSAHFYAAPTSSLKLWHPTLDQVLGGADLDYGDIAAGGNYSKTFRVKNTHATQTAHAVVVTREALTDKSPSMVGATHLFSIDGGAYATSCAVGDLAPGAISDVITVQRDIPVGAQVGLGAGRYVAQAGSWS